MPGQIASIKTRQFIVERLVPSLLKISVRCFILFIYLFIYFLTQRLLDVLICPLERLPLLHLFERNLRSLLYNSAHDSAAWKNNVQAQQSEEAVKILQQNCSPRLQAAVRKMSLRSSPKRRRKRGAYHLSAIFSENFLTDGTGHSLPKNEKRSEPFQLSVYLRMSL